VVTESRKEKLTDGETDKGTKIKRKKEETKGRKKRKI
jgi:hypothetical protein